MEIDLSKPLPDEVVFILRSKAYEFQRDGVEKIVENCKDIISSIISQKERDTLFLHVTFLR